MKNMQIIRKMITGTAVVAMSFTLAACGSHNTAKSTSSSSSQTEQAASKSDTYREANKLIREKDYQGAYDTLMDVEKRSTSENNLAKDLKNYLRALNQYKTGNYTTALNMLKNQSSTSAAMRDSYSSLRAKVNNTKKGHLSSSQAKAASSSAATKSGSNTTTAETEGDEVVAFANKMGFSGDKGYQIIEADASGSTYKFVVRRNNSDNTISNMVGIYEYNAATGAVTQVH